ncbi:MAG: alpha/beta hydrolase [Phenylobacterium sp.]
MKSVMLAGLAALVLALPMEAAAQAPALPAAIFTDPPSDKAHPARMVVLHIPSGGVQINGVAYVAAGAGPHPTVILFHGLPGNEKNLDLAQAIRRAGWTVVTLNYRGSWGSPGAYSFAGDLEDAKAALAFVRAPANAERLQIDTARLVLAGHSLGGWVTAMTAAQDPGVKGAVLISAADMGGMGKLPRKAVGLEMADNMESLAGTSPQAMAEEIVSHADAFALKNAIPGLAGRPLLVLGADDGLAQGTDALVAAIRARGGKQVTTRHVATDHGWSDRRIALEAAVIGWLQGVK